MRCLFCAVSPFQFRLLFPFASFRFRNNNIILLHYLAFYENEPWKQRGVEVRKACFPAGNDSLTAKVTNVYVYWSYKYHYYQLELVSVFIEFQCLLLRALVYYSSLIIFPQYCIVTIFRELYFFFKQISLKVNKFLLKLFCQCNLESLSVKQKLSLILF